MLKVSMFGTFKISNGNFYVGGYVFKRSRVWNVLTYLLFHHRRMVPSEELVRLFGGLDKIENPKATLRTVLTRARSNLEPLGENLPKEAILGKNGSYGWNPDFSLELDVEEFESLYKLGNSAKNSKDALECYRKAIKLFKGPFLERLDGEAWVMETGEYYNRLYLDMVMRAVPMLEAEGCLEEAVAICRAAVRLSPYDERLTRHIMRNLMRTGDYGGAEAAYQEMSDRLKADLGTRPEEESQSLYKEIGFFRENRYMPLPMIMEQLEGQNLPAGALICDYSLFKLMFWARSRTAERKGDSVHVVVLSVKGRHDRLLSGNMLKQAMEQIREVLKVTLRSEDVASACSAAQYVLMLSQISEENSHRVMRRVVDMYMRQYPSMPVELGGEVLL